MPRPHDIDLMGDQMPLNPNDASDGEERDFASFQSNNPIRVGEVRSDLPFLDVAG